MLKLTTLDKKILFELDKDGRASFSKIAKAIGTSPQVVKYHYSRLMDFGAIRHFWAFIDYDRAGYPFFWGYWLKFSGQTEDQENAMYKKLADNKYIPIVMRCGGYADAMIGIIARDVFHHNQILQEIFNGYGSYITQSDIVVGLGFLKFPRTYFIGQENSSGIFHTSGGHAEPTRLSELDHKILSLLQINGRMEFAQMAKVLGVSPGLVHRNYTRLVKQKVITKITFTLNYEMLNLKLFRVSFKIKQFNKDRIEALYQFCLQHPNIINYVKVMGNWQLMLDIEIPNQNDLRNLILQMKHVFNDIIFEIEVNDVYQVDKFTQMAIEYPDLQPPAEELTKQDKLSIL